MSTNVDSTIEVSKQSTRNNNIQFPPDKSPQNVSWSDLTTMEGDEPGSGKEAWKVVKQEASRHLESGHRAARTFDKRKTPWDEAQFHVLRTSFVDDCQPTNAVEGRLVDMLAVIYSAWEWWFELSMIFATNTGVDVQTTLDQEGLWHPPRLDTVRTQELAVSMADRYHRQFMRTLRALRDLRRYAPAVNIGNAEQVNIAAQQINTAVKE
jgi:hypothetical protein